MSGMPPSKITKTSEMRSRCPAVVTCAAPTAAATAKESRPSGSTKASSFPTTSGTHDLPVSSLGQPDRVALAGFGLDSLIEIGASVVVIWELSGTGAERQRRGLRLIGWAFAILAVYLLIQSTVVLAAGYHPRHSLLGIIWTAVTAAAMFTLAAGKARTGAALGNPVLQTEGRGTMIDGILADAVRLGLVLNAAAGWWWADPAAGYVLVYYAAREVREIFTTRR